MHLAATELPSGFWSYAHKDNGAEHDRILHLCELIQNEFELLSGRALQLFTDRNGIAWGNKWRATIDSVLTETTFFIAVVTPRYIASRECRHELLLFRQNAQARGVSELLFPILYADVDGFVENSEDEVKATIAQAQYVSFTELRLADEQSSKYRTAINSLAKRLIDIANMIATKEATEPSEVGVIDADQAGPSGDHIDLIADQLVPEWQAIQTRIIQLWDKVAEITNEFQPKLIEADQRGDVRAGLAVLKQYAADLMPIAEEFRAVGARYLEQAKSFTTPMLAILNQLNNLPKDQPFDASIIAFLELMRTIAKGGQDTAASVQNYQDATEQFFAGFSRDIRGALELFNVGAESFLDGNALFDDWVRRIDETLKVHDGHNSESAPEEGM
jgi:hypothetical protein